MNLSGEAVREVADYYKTEPENIIVIYDDINLEPGSSVSGKKAAPVGITALKILSLIWEHRNFHESGWAWRETQRLGSGRLCAGPF